MKVLIFGKSHDDRAIYDYAKMIEFLIINDGFSEEEAIDFISYNTIQVLSYYKNSPIILFERM